MQLNPLVTLSIAWILGAFIGLSFLSLGETTPPSLIAVFGFVLFALLSGTFYFGKIAPLFTLILAMLQSAWLPTFPVSTLLLGVSTIGASLYGRTLGELALTDLYENAQTRLPGLTLAALLNFLLILGFTLVVWCLFTILPSGAQFQHWFPFQGLGV